MSPSVYLNSPNSLVSAYSFISIKFLSNFFSSTTLSCFLQLYHIPYQYWHKTWTSGCLKCKCFLVPCDLTSSGVLRESLKGWAARDSIPWAGDMLQSFQAPKRASTWFYISRLLLDLLGLHGVLFRCLCA